MCKPLIIDLRLVNDIKKWLVAEAEVKIMKQRQASTVVEMYLERERLQRYNICRTERERNRNIPWETVFGGLKMQSRTVRPVWSLFEPFLDKA